MKKSILIVEDDKEIRETITEVLEIEGYKVYAAGNGQEGIDILRNCETPPGLIILDLMMPVMDGYGFRDMQNRDEMMAAVPTVLLSADSNLVDKARQLGVKNFIKKPVEIAELTSMANRFCAN